MGMYFSGNVFLQNLVAPTIKNVPLFTAREFGVLEILQNLMLLCVGFYSFKCFIAATQYSVKLFALALILISVFVLLEEIDYGIHFVEFLSGQYGSLDPATWNRNWHNKTDLAGMQNVSYLKLASNIAMVTGFVLGPLLFSSSRYPLIRLLVPNRWMIATVILSVMLSLLAHWLDDAGFAIISGIHGNLEKNISEFRELNMYYLFLLYTALLHERIARE